MHSDAASAGPASASLFTRPFVLVLCTQATFAFGWSLYLLMPKFMSVELGAGPEQIGTVAFAGSAAGVLMIPVAAIGIDRIGRRIFLQLGCVLIVALSLLALTVHSIGPALYAVQACMSAAYILAFNASATLVADRAPPERLGHAIGIIGAVSPFMNAVATASGEALAESMGWSALFLLGACAGGLALALSFLVREPSRRAPGHGTARTLEEDSQQSLGPLLAATFLIGCAFTAIFVFFQPYVLALGATEVRGFFVGFTVSAVVVRVVFGDLGDRFGRRRVSLVTSLLYGVSAASMIGLDPDWLWAYGVGFGVVHGLLYPTLNALVVSCMPETQRGRAMTFYNGAFNVGSAVSSLGWGLMASRLGYASVFWTAMVCALLAASVLFRRENWVAQAVAGRSR